MKLEKIFITAAFVFALPFIVFGQTNPSENRFKLTTTKTERIDLGQGGSVTILGAPAGSIAVEAWSQTQVEITAEISSEAASAEDLNLLAQVNGFVADADINSIRVVTVGIHDRQYLKKNFKNFPKRLLNVPWRVDYRIKIPPFTDLEINAGRGDLELNGVEGLINVKSVAAENANLNLTGGTLQATFGSGKINFKVGARSWRGNGADIQVAKGELNVQMPPDMNADINAEILRSGRIENSFQTLKPRGRVKFTEKAMQARGGAGGAKFFFTIGDGALRLKSEARNGN